MLESILGYVVNGATFAEDQIEKIDQLDVDECIELGRSISKKIQFDTVHVTLRGSWVESMVVDLIDDNRDVVYPSAIQRMGHKGELAYTYASESFRQLARFMLWMRGAFDEDAFEAGSMALPDAYRSATDDCSITSWGTTEDYESKEGEEIYPFDYLADLNNPQEVNLKFTDWDNPQEVTLNIAYMELSSIVFESKGEQVFSVVEISHRMKIVLFYAIVYAAGFDAADFEPGLEVALGELE